MTLKYLEPDQGTKTFSNLTATNRRFPKKSLNKIDVQIGVEN